MITLEDIARRTGVSHSTVSRALANSPLVNAKTKALIQSLAREVGYEVNQVARNLKTRSTQMIGLVVPEVSNPFYPKLIQRIANHANSAGYNLQLHLSGSDQSAETVCVSSLRSHQADGILLITAEQGLVAREQVNALITASIPVVVMGWIEDAEHIDMVTGDDDRGGYDLAQYLMGLGHQRIAVLGKTPHRGPFDRLRGFKRALDEVGLTLPDELSIAAQNEEEIHKGVQELLALPNPPTAIFAYQDSLAALVYKCLRKANIAIPEQMSVVGFDDIDLATYLHPPLTTVGMHIEPLAQEFVRLLLARIHKELPSMTAEHIVVTPRVIIRDSCTSPKKQIDLDIYTKENNKL